MIETLGIFNGKQRLTVEKSNMSDLVKNGPLVKWGLKIPFSTIQIGDCVIKLLILRFQVCTDLFHKDRQSKTFSLKPLRQKPFQHRCDKVGSFFQLTHLKQLQRFEFVFEDFSSFGHGHLFEELNGPRISMRLEFSLNMVANAFLQ